MLDTIKGFSVGDKTLGKYAWVFYIFLGLAVVYLVYWIVTNIIGKFGEGLGKTAGNIGAGAVEASKKTVSSLVGAGKETVDYFDESVGLSDWLTSPRYSDNGSLAYARARSDFARSMGVSADKAVDYGFPNKTDWLAQNGF